ncbi:MAG: hypothetical protein V4644_03610 [Patescibacteria group bacterium]
MRGFTSRSEGRAQAAGLHMSRATKKQSHSYGFTLVETLVAITVILTALVGPLYAVQQSLSTSRSAREQLIASSLAQEAVEFVRGIRDSNYIYNTNAGGSRNWLAGLDGTQGAYTSVDCFQGDCVIDSTTNSASRTVSTLYLSAGDNLYNQSGGTLTPYTRTVRLEVVPGSTKFLGPEVKLTVTVSWSSRGQARSVVISERLHNWL